MASILQKTLEACQASKFVSRHGSAYLKETLEQNKQYIQDPPTIEKYNLLLKQLFYTRLARVSKGVRDLPGNLQSAASNIPFGKSLTFINRDGIDFLDAQQIGLERCFVIYNWIGAILHKSFKGAKCKTSLKLTVARTKLLKNKKGLSLVVMKRELAQLIEAGQERTASFNDIFSSWCLINDLIVALSKIAANRLQKELSECLMTKRALDEEDQRFVAFADKPSENCGKLPLPQVPSFVDDDDGDVNQEIIRQATTKKVLKDVEEQHWKALEEDPLVFYYDGAYDEIKSIPILFIQTAPKKILASGNKTAKADSLQVVPVIGLEKEDQSRGGAAGSVSDADIRKYQAFAQTLQQSRGLGSEFQFAEARAGFAAASDAFAAPAAAAEDDELYS
ncbi:hypothetical protein GIB67_029463 [Kingdonia uniflora]|uniref:Uncharacterized protein n=1 Tax=Kingdonia uniflora TaxID=39325 RepID=A0A7J7NXY1_9MAGN|nr:hypothetical protein GIB67_029463 [Kingdonia uniflora]